MKRDRIYLAFSSKSAESAKILVFVISINTVQVTFKNQEDIQNCLRCGSSGAEMVNLDLVCRKTFLDTFHCQLHAITNYFSACDIVTSSHRLPIFRTGIADTCRKKCWREKTVSVLPCVMGECRCYMFSSLTSCSSQTSALLFAEEQTTILTLHDGLARIIQT